MVGGETRTFTGIVPEATGDYPHAPMFGPLPASVLYVRHVDGLVLTNVRLRVQARDVRPRSVFDDVRILRADRVSHGRFVQSNRGLPPRRLR